MKKRDLRPIAGPGSDPGNYRVVDDQIVVPVFPRPVLTNSPPTEPGLYWYRLDVERSGLRHARVWLRDGKLEAITADGMPKDVRTFARLWAGPLLEPIELEPRPRTRKK